MTRAPIRGVTAYLRTVLRIRKRWFPTDPTAEVWFRGAGDATHDLLPGAYWRAQCDEGSMIWTFRNLVPALLPREPVDEWEWYYLMQHYGLPTRLLDWTENPLTALYFALESPCPPGVSPCVWMFDPLSLNRLSGFEFILTTQAGADTDHWLPGACGRGIDRVEYGDGDGASDNSRPVAVFPKRHNPRIVAQRGTFTVHGAAEVPINRMDLRDERGRRRPAIRLDIAPAARDLMWEDLWALGITKSSIYPEPQSLADDIKRQYGAV